MEFYNDYPCYPIILLTLRVKEDEMGGECRTNGEEEECM
jgi:hypothetical protein